MYNSNDLDKLRACLPQYVESITRRSIKGGRDVYDCPLCGSGQHNSKTGAFRLYRDSNSWFCFSCQSKDKGSTERGGDIFELIRQHEGITDFNKQVQRAAEFAGITVEYENRQNAQNATESRKAGNLPPESAKAENGQNMAAEQQNYTNYYSLCAAQIEQAAGYLNQRGISLDTARKYNIGFDAIKQRVIIPVTDSFYVARATDPNDPIRYLNAKGSSAALWGTRDLYAPEMQEVFVVEGMFDALSLAEIGYAAVALNSTSNAELLLKTLESKRPTAAIIISLDNDAGGSRATEKLKEGLETTGIPFITANISGDHKDPNEHLTADRAAFTAAADAAAERAERYAARPDSAALYAETQMTADMQRFLQNGRPTGFPNWDKITGGLHAPGLYLMAAHPGAGKTTFCYQLADQLAAMGNDVLYYTLEQNRLDLVSKSLARRIKQKNKRTTLNSTIIRQGGYIKPPESSAEFVLAEEVRAAAASFVKETGGRLSVIDSNYGKSAQDIFDEIGVYIRRTGCKPIVIVDYLQRLKPTKEAEHMQIRERIDESSKILCKARNEYGITMIVISSVNRASYRAPLDMEALKESGNLEFDGDAVYVLELSCMGEAIFEEDGKTAEKRRIMDAAKGKEPRRMVIRCIKSRFSGTGQKAFFDYYAANDLFVEAEGFEPTKENEYIPFKQGRR